VTRTIIALATAALVLAAAPAYAKSPLIIGEQIADDSLTGADILESSLGTIPSAARADGLRQVVRVHSDPPAVATPADANTRLVEATAICPPGMTAVGGGFRSFSANPPSGFPTWAIDIQQSFPIRTTIDGQMAEGWRVRAHNQDAGATEELSAYVNCIEAATLVERTAPSGQFPIP
jgi:hypothetical protein